MSVSYTGAWIGRQGYALMGVEWLGRKISLKIHIRVNIVVNTENRDYVKNLRQADICTKPALKFLLL